MICSVCQTTLQAAISHFRIAKNQDAGHFFQPISVNGPNGVYAEDHHKTWNDFMYSVDQKCHICWSLWSWINEADRRILDNIWQEIATGTIPNAYGNAASQLLLNYRRHRDYQCFTFSFRVLTKPETSDRKPMFLAEQPFREFQFVLDLVQGKPYVVPTLETSTWSPRAQRLARNWVGDCVDNHKQCRYSKGDIGWYPTRLLDLSESTEVRLIETKDTKLAGQYATVTHRWGHVDENFVLNKERYPQLKKGIPLDSMPQLFRDTISIARLLGTQYLWIDSLCIFQDKDDKTDWAHEASLMEKVYSYSYCNISAADAENCSRSLFNARDPQSINPKTLTLDIVSDEIGGVIPVQFYVLNCDSWLEQVSAALVNTRAWVLQERILAPRVLHFGKRQLMWECCEVDASEVFPHGLHPELAASELVRFKSFNLELDQGAQRGYFENHELPVPRLLWNRIIQYYTYCKLSRSEDKLIACSGVAKRFQSMIQDTYVAGMWRTDLEAQLLWIKSLGTGLRRGVYRAPSWSWASIDGVIWPSTLPQDGCLFEIEDVHLSYATPDKTGGITAGWLRLRGVLLETKLVKMREHEAVFDVYLEGVSVAADFTTIGRVSPIVAFDSAEGSVDYENVEGRIFSMVGHAGNERLTMGLLLFKLVNEQRGVFERIGMVIIDHKEQNKKILSIRRESEKPPLPCAEFKDGKHTIIVI
ncbi:heterokaryon incompatibility protein-domain-containing protein [Neurospora crassa]|nr:heterokaryon incompatibility protein-domain-containing protein [Neurospora crassa]